MSILVFGWVFCILSHSDPVLFTNAFVIVVVGVLGSYLIHEIGHWLALSVTSPDAEARWESTLLRISLSFAVAHPREQSRSMRLPAP